MSKFEEFLENQFLSKERWYLNSREQCVLIGWNAALEAAAEKCEKHDRRFQSDYSAAALDDAAAAIRHMKHRD